MRLKVVYEPSDEGVYTAYGPSLPGCISEGDAMPQSSENLREAVQLYLESTGDPVPAEGGMVEELVV
ncbi:MAG TPA: type II toxin-antitoxin system HicB family antitoxin [Pirellulaceae bacterium]|nr:type II toxin-antitoxin system HicB family antitoxin [Pirellulaceae bacterium]